MSDEIKTKCDSETPTDEMISYLRRDGKYKPVFFDHPHIADRLEQLTNFKTLFEGHMTNCQATHRRNVAMITANSEQLDRAKALIQKVLDMGDLWLPPEGWTEEHHGEAQALNTMKTSLEDFMDGK